MRLCFIFPHPVSGPTGGYKVVYEYANRFARDGYDVDIVYAGSIFWKQKPLRFKLTNCLRYLQKRISGYSGRNWFALDPRVKEHFTLSMNYRHMPKADIYIATSPYTAFYLNGYPIDYSRKFYLIQDKEDWGPGLKDILYKTYKMPLRKIVISNWLQKMLWQEHKEKSILIPNGFDFTKFNINIPINEKDPLKISMLYHSMDRKDCNTGFKALKIVKRQYPTLKVLIFGVPSRPTFLPEWYEYFQMPDDKTHNWINNTCGIFIGTSKREGWGLTLGEAMICGQAVCCTDNDGYKETAIDNDTALLSPIGEPESLAANIFRLIKDNDLRIRIAKSGNKFIQKFNWEDSFQAFKKVIN